jgi:hypothetical protein
LLAFKRIQQLFALRSIALLATLESKFDQLSGATSERMDFRRQSSHASSKAMPFIRFTLLSRLPMACGRRLVRFDDRRIKMHFHKFVN